MAFKIHVPGGRNRSPFRYSVMLDRMRTVLKSLFLLSITCSTLYAQNPSGMPPMYVGGGLQVAFNWHNLNVPVYRNDTLCGTFQHGTSILPSGYLLFEKPLGVPAHSLWIAPRLHLTDLGATISTPSADAARARSPLDSSLQAVDQVSHLDATLLALGADLFVKYPLTSRLFLFGGPSISYLIQRNWQVSELILSPSYALFPNGTQSRTIASGQIPNSTSIFASATVGASLDVPLSEKVVLAPELSFTAPLTSIRSDDPWRVWSVSLGAAIKFNIAPEPKMEAIIQPPPPKPTSELAATVAISGVIHDSTGKEVEIPDPQIQIEEFLKLEAFPTLNYIFFGDDSAQIPSRYHLFASEDSAGSFNDSTLSGVSTLAAYHEELNILGKRLHDTPAIGITLTGTNSEDSTEAGDTSIARKRAESVRDYLVHIWKIDPGRISIRTEGLPENPSPANTPAGDEENRRVEITSSDPAFLDPLVVQTIDRTMNPPVIRLRSSYRSRLSLVENTLSLTQGNRVLTSYRSPGPMVQWKPNSNEMPRTDSPLVATMHLTDSLGTNYSTSDTTNVNLITIRKKREERIKDKIIEDYNLITFNFDKSDLTDGSQRVISEIAKSVTPNTRIKITGYTDVTGESQHNLELSEARAKAVEDALRSTLGPLVDSVTFQTQGEGQADLVDNRYPEGRFLSRTVFVELQKPVQ